MSNGLSSFFFCIATAAAVAASVALLFTEADVSHARVNNQQRRRASVEPQLQLPVSTPHVPHTIFCIHHTAYVWMNRVFPSAFSIYFFAIAVAVASSSSTICVCEVKSEEQICTTERTKDFLNDEMMMLTQELWTREKKYKIK